MFCTGVMIGIIRVLTSEHCVPPTGDGILVEALPARVVKKNEFFALLDVNPLITKPNIKIAASKPKVGDPVTSIGLVDLIGTRLTLRRSTAGYAPTIPMMFIDGPLVGGMSGGPVVNERGELVGINQASNNATGLVSTLDAIKDFLK